MLPLDRCGAAPVNDTLEAACDVAGRLAAEAGALQLARRDCVYVESKAHANDLVSDVDRASEKLIVDGLAAAFPTDAIVGEEGHQRTGTSGRRWIIDPIDGTRNYLTGAGPWSVSIALTNTERTLVGVVHDPASGETFDATVGAGARLGGRRLTASSCRRLAEAIVGICYGTSVETKRRAAPIIAELLPVVGDIRRLPAALHLTYLAAGRFDAGVLLDTQPWDVAAGLLIAAEAGVLLGGAGGQPAPEFAVAAAPGIWDQLVTALGPTEVTVG